MSDLLKYHQILGTSPETSAKGIKNAYRKLAKRHHPDVNKGLGAHAKFLEITEAYEILTGQRKFPSGFSQKTKSREEIIAEKVSLARERYERMMQEDRRLDKLYYRRVAFGLPWNFFRVGSVYCVIWSVLFCIDYFSTSERKTIEPSDLLFNPLAKSLSVESADAMFNISELQYWQNNRYFVRGNYSLLFHDLRSVTVIVEPVEGWSHKKDANRMLALTDFEMYKTKTFYSAVSIYAVFPVLHIILFVPLILVIYKRPTLRFNLWRLISLWVIFPVIFLLSLSNDRIFHLFGF